MDAFFASIEIVNNPALKGKPVIIGGDKRGVVSTCSYEARAYGVRSAMPVSTARRLCPHGIFIHGSYSNYRKISEEIFTILHEFSPLVEETSIDEAYMDITAEEDPLIFGRRLKESILKKTSLTASVGIGPNKMIAKMASSHKKPNGLFQVLPEHVRSFLEPLPVGAIPGIGKVTEEDMHILGIKTIKDLRDRQLLELIDEFGARGYIFYKEARGIDHRKVEGPSAPKSIGCETTFDEDIDDISLLEEELEGVVIKAHKRLRDQKLKTKGLTLKMRFHNFETVTRSATFLTYTGEVEALIFEAKKLLLHVFSGVPLRLIGVTFDKLNDGWWQPTFFD